MFGSVGPVYYTLKMGHTALKKSTLNNETNIIAGEIDKMQLI